jgi:two-component system sensor histidine kinase PilS (NtrC family)
MGGVRMIRLETKMQLRWLMTLRVVTVTTLLISVFCIELLLRPRVSLKPLFLLGATAYGMVVLYGLLHRWARDRQELVLLQLFGDALLITFFLQITGGLESPMSFLYVLPICVGSILLYRRGGLALAGACWMLYAGLAAVDAGWLPFGSLVAVSEVEPGRASYLLVAHLVAMLAFALLSSYLSERLRSQEKELVDRQRTVARLKALNENIIESINSGLITTNLHGEINFMNRGGAEILGYAQPEVEGRSVESLFDLESGFIVDTRKRLLEKHRFRFERYFDTKQGRTIFLGIAVSNLYDKTGRPLGYIFIFQDLTEIHALEQEMRLKERMVALGEMAAGMAHELRNPLAAISGSVQYLKGDLKPQGETLELMDIILRESHRLDGAIRDFLLFARPGRFTPEPADLVKLLEDNVKLLRKSHELRPEHGIQTRFSAEEVECEVDPNRLKQVFWNLATNALKAMPAGGTLTIAVDVDPGGDRVDVRFIDEGVGMDLRQQELYFQPFSSSFVRGTGLGAAIVYRLVEEHGGRIQLESDAGHGTCVCISLPRRQGAVGASAVAFPLSVAGGAR